MRYRPGKFNTRARVRAQTHGAQKLVRCANAGTTGRYKGKQALGINRVEIDENLCRSDLTASQHSCTRGRVEMGVAIERVRGERRLATLKNGAAIVRDNFPLPEIIQIRDTVAKAACFDNGKVS